MTPHGDESAEGIVIEKISLCVIVPHLLKAENEREIWRLYRVAPVEQDYGSLIESHSTTSFVREHLLEDQSCQSHIFPGFDSRYVVILSAILRSHLAVDFSPAFSTDPLEFHSL